MWIVVGGRTKVNRVEGGREAKHPCKECEKITSWSECDMVDKLEVFFVSLLDMKSRRMVCMTCGEDLDPAEIFVPAPPPALSPAKPIRRDDPEIDDMLAELKARIRK